MRIFTMILMLAILLGANYYVFYRLVQMTPPVSAVRILLVVVGVILTLSPFLAIIFGRQMSSSVISVVYNVGTSWLIVFLYLLLVFLLLDIIRITHLLPVEKIMYKSWAGLGIMAIVVIFILGWGYYRYTHKKRVEVDIKVNKEMSSGNRLKIVAISDLHLGYTIGKKEFESWIELINNENADVLLIAGDITDNNIEPLHKQQIEESFKKIKTRYGTFAALGNHEYIAGIEYSMGFLKKTGMTILRDSAVLVNNSFYIIGRDDRSNHHRKTIEELTGTLDKSKPIILIDHQPYDLDETEKNRIDLQISGHTHDGQVWPVSLLVKLMYENPHGYLQKGESHIYVSSGLGLWGGKFRVGTQSEYVVINLETVN